MDLLAWRVDLGMIIQYRINTINQMLTMTQSKLVNKNLYYIHLLHNYNQSQPIPLNN